MCNLLTTTTKLRTKTGQDGGRPNIDHMTTQPIATLATATIPSLALSNVELGSGSTFWYTNNIAVRIGRLFTQHTTESRRSESNAFNHYTVG